MKQLKTETNTAKYIKEEYMLSNILSYIQLILDKNPQLKAPTDAELEAMQLANNKKIKDKYKLK